VGELKVEAVREALAGIPRGVGGAVALAADDRLAARLAAVLEAHEHRQAARRGALLATEVNRQLRRYRRALSRAQHALEGVLIGDRERQVHREALETLQRHAATLEATPLDRRTAEARQRDRLVSGLVRALREGGYQPTADPDGLAAWVADLLLPLARPRPVYAFPADDARRRRVLFPARSSCQPEKIAPVPAHPDRGPMHPEEG
jgi:hypothetical protein